MAIRSDQLSSGRYVQGGEVTVTNNGSRLGWWERTVFDKSTSDVPFKITAKYRYRPDRLAYDVYGRADYQWVILQYNNVVDLFTDFDVGVIISLPTTERLFSELLSKS